MKLSTFQRGRSSDAQHGFTLLELIIATMILLILTSMAIPLARVTIKREKERELRRDLWEMRDSIDRYKDAAERGAYRSSYWMVTEGCAPFTVMVCSGGVVTTPGNHTRRLQQKITLLEQWMSNENVAPLRSRAQVIFRLNPAFPRRTVSNLG